MENRKEQPLRSREYEKSDFVGQIFGSSTGTMLTTAAANPSANTVYLNASNLLNTTAAK